MNLIQNFLEKKGIEDIIVTYDKNNEPVTPSYILQEFMKELYPIHGVVGRSEQLVCKCKTQHTKEELNDNECVLCWQPINAN